MRNQKRSQIASAILRKNTKLEGPKYLISNYTTKPMQSKQPGTDIKTDIDQWNRIESQK